MMTQQHIEEGLSRAYVAAAAARAGINVGVPLHDYGVDGTFSKIGSKAGRRLDTGVKLDYQLKASKNWRIDGETILYDLEAKTYNDLVERSRGGSSVPMVLIFLCLPGETLDWLDINEERLLMRKCCYWVYPTGLPTNNRRTVTIHIPRNQLLTPAAIAELLDQVKAGSFNDSSQSK